MLKVFNPFFKVTRNLNFGVAGLLRKSYSSNSLGSAPSSYAENDASYLGDALSTHIPTEVLIYEKHGPKHEVHEMKSPIVFLHGLFGSKSNNRTVAKFLADSMERNVYCLDLRNFGRSPHNERLDYPSLAADVEVFLDKLRQHNQHKPILVGHSMGAKTVMAVALRRPDLPKMIVSVDNAPVDLAVSSMSSFNRYIKQLRYAIEVCRYTNMKDVDQELSKVEPSAVVRQFLEMNLIRGKTGDAIKSRVPLDIIQKAVSSGNISGWPYDSNISRWSRGPVLVIRGIQSAYVPDEVIPDIGKYFPRFEVRDIDAGHWVISEKQQEFLEVLTDFIERHED